MRPCISAKLTENCRGQETFRAPVEKGERGAFTAIYFLLAEGQKSHWHKVDAVETWLWHSGALRAPLRARIHPRPAAMS